jgi:hypothetical protein
MIWFRYNKMSDYNDKELWTTHKIQYTKHPREKYISMLYNRECMEVSRKIRKRWLGFGSITLLKKGALFSLINSCTISKWYAKNITWKIIQKLDVLQINLKEYITKC